MPQPVTVLLVPPLSRPAEAEAALRWLRSLPEVEADLTTREELPDRIGDGASVVWYHAWEPPAPHDELRMVLDAHIRAGGGLLATLAAALLPERLGWETVAPNELTAGAWKDEAEDLAFADSFSVLPRVRGLQSFRGHPIFEGLGGGCYTWDPEEGEPFVRCAYAADVWPAEGRVLAVQRSYIAMNEQRRLAWEYVPGDGWAVCIGGYIHFAARNATHRPHLERLMRNALHRVRPERRKSWLLGGVWKPAELGVEGSTGAPLPAPIPEGLGAGPDLGSEVVLERAAIDETYTLAGARTLLVGRETSGVEEIWFHPVRAVSRWQLDRDSDDGSGSLAAGRYRIGRGVVERRLSAGDRIVLERTRVARNEAAVLIELEPESGEGGTVPVVLTLEMDLRLMWPYPASAAGGLIYQANGGAIGVRSDAGEWMGVRVDPPPGGPEVEDASARGGSRLRARWRLSLDGPTRILITGAGRAERPPRSIDPRAWRSDDPESGEPVGETYRAPESSEEAKAAMHWAAWRLTTYRVHVPGLGTSLVAGYNRSRRGPFFDGRPGFAWFFGRDAIWTALAALSVGRLRMAQEVLEFLGRHQDITGKILHECTSSGVVHYDAADSTPLYLLLAARYLERSGDEATVRREWSRIVRAFEFCLTTDRDGDGLIENTGVGHGWVEFGPLGENHVSLYLAGIWVAALAELEDAARRLGEGELAEELAYSAAAARSALELAFFDPVEGRYATGLRADGSRNMAESVMTAVPLLLGAVRPERCERWLDRVASDAFTAPWGVRIMPNDVPGYDPGGYHTGAVWPLFTGWVALAEARSGRLESSRRHWKQILALYDRYALGAFPEVLHGEEPRRIGVTPDQAWSTAMALWPAHRRNAERGEP